MLSLLIRTAIICTLATAAFTQTAPWGHIGQMSGAPSGNCPPGLADTSLDITTGKLYICDKVAGTWNPVPIISTSTGTAIPTGLISLVITGTCPSGWTEVSALNGKMLRGTVAANGDVGATGGSATITPTGTVSAPTFTGNAVISSAVSAGTPAGTNGTASFTPAGTNGTATTGATSGGTPAGTNSAVSATATAAVAVTTGSGNSMATNAHTHPAPTFTGSALATHTHTVPAETFTGSAGTVPAETFTGSALATHTHTTTATGTVSQPTFTGSAVDPSPAYLKVIFCSKN
jgi:hypothetical protein